MAENKLKRSWMFALGIFVIYIGYKWIYSFASSSLSQSTSTGPSIWIIISLLGILVTVFGLLILGRSFFNE